jgi:hypothetical protein
MCDYSLGGLPNRLATAGEELIVHRFRTGSKGLASPTDVRPVQPIEAPAPQMSLWCRLKNFFVEQPQHTLQPPAVCVPPGATLVMKNVPVDLQRRWCVGTHEEVRFVQCSADVNRYRDSLQFKDRRQILLQELREGMCLQVVSLGGSETGDEQDYVVSRQGDRAGTYR